MEEVLAALLDGRSTACCSGCSVGGGGGGGGGCITEGSRAFGGRSGEGGLSAALLRQGA